MTSEETPEQGQVSETTGLDKDHVQGGIQGEGEPSTAAIRDQDGPPEAELASPDERTDDADPEDAEDLGVVEDAERRVGWADE
ncbi:hypothetical protein O9K63_10740 [Janibacter cremeus]|uniref:hypothetical protein n=1 Tax=Janibacter cremeus TaxID=1285192 RepID=UPI0023F9BC25|nr:hypothetical protein [Janibacter cremeus]WEV77068.1 hypothetical protein O9K63_10740 [Janibacter cremeus]